MKTKILILLSFLSFLVVQAQDWQWIKKGGSTGSSSNLDERIIDIATDSNRNVYIISEIGVGNTNIDNHSKTFWGSPTSGLDTQISSFSCDGTYRWSKIIGSGGECIIRSIAIDSQDNIYVSGRFGGALPNSYPPRIDNDYIMTSEFNRLSYLAKFSPDGTLQWIQRPENNDNVTRNVLQMFIKNDIIYWFVYITPGTYADGAFTNTEPGKNVFVFKYDTSGNFLGATYINGFSTYGGVRVNFYINPYNDNYYLLWVSTGSGTATINSNELASSNLIACWDVNGIFQWVTTDTSTTPQEATDFVIYGLDFDQQSNIYLTGVAANNFNVSFLGFSPESNTNHTRYVMKVNPTATQILWNNYVSNYGSYGTMAIKLKGDELAITGTANGTFTWDNLTINVNAGNGADVLFARFDKQTGSILSMDSIASTEGSQDTGSAIETDINGDYLVGGSFAYDLTDAYGNTTFSTGGNQDFFISKYATGACNALSVENPNYNNISLYPNPTKNSLYLSTPNNTVKSISIYSVLGQEIKLPITPAYQGSYINTTTLNKGTYFITIKTNTNEIKKKFVKE